MLPVMFVLVLPYGITSDARGGWNHKCLRWSLTSLYGGLPSRDLVFS